jgi:hypothetical protein
VTLSKDDPHVRQSSFACDLIEMHIPGSPGLMSWVLTGLWVSPGSLELYFGT